METSSPPPPPERRPWPLRWIVWAVLLYALIHTGVVLFWASRGNL